MFIRIYAAAVCFASIMCIAISAGIGLYDTVQITFPEFTLESYQRQGPNDAFPVGYPYPIHLRGGPGASLVESGIAKAVPTLTPEEQQKIQQRRLDTAIDNTRHDAQRSLIQIIIILMISIPLFIIHWRFVRRLERTADQ